MGLVAVFGREQSTLEVVNFWTQQTDTRNIYTDALVQLELVADPVPSFRTLKKLEQPLTESGYLLHRVLQFKRPKELYLKRGTSGSPLTVALAPRGCDRSAFDVVDEAE